MNQNASLEKENSRLSRFPFCELFGECTQARAIPQKKNDARSAKGNKNLHL